MQHSGAHPAALKKAAIFAYRIPLVRPIPSAGLLLTQREGLVLQLRQGSACGWGEAAPLPGFSPESLEQSQQDLQRLASIWLDDKPPTEVACPSARFGLSCALHELQQGPLHEPTPLIGHPLLQGDPESIRQQWQLRSSTTPPRSIKLKLARQSLEAEISLVQQLLAQTPELKLRIDCNQGWNLAQAAAFLAVIPMSAIEYLEEPCHVLQHSLQLSTQTGVPLALDESLRQPGFYLPEHSGIQALILKPSLIGSLTQLYDSIHLAQQRGLRAILSSSYESSLGLSQLAALASQLTPLEPPGLDTAAAFSVNLLRASDPTKATFGIKDLSCVWRGASASGVHQ